MNNLIEYYVIILKSSGLLNSTRVPPRFLNSLALSNYFSNSSLLSLSSSYFNFSNSAYLFSSSSYYYY